MGDYSATSNTNMNTDHFSGTQASLYIGDVWVDDVVNYSFRVEHSRTPVYGYGSQHYDLMPKGTIIVMGEFTVNFREPNYLWLIIERYKRFQRQGGRRTEQRNEKLKNKIQDNTKTFGDDSRANIDMFLNAKDGPSARLIRDNLDESFIDNSGVGSGSVTTREYWNHDSFQMIFGYGRSGENSIGERLSGVELMGKARVVQADGTPIQETYSFIGRDFR
jgi:hypothetical protein